LTGKCIRTLFVGVDEYDAPANNSTFTSALARMDGGILEKVTKVEQFFKINFFSVLKEACGRLGDGPAIIGKYFLTGVTPAFRAGISPLAGASLVSGRGELHGMCGFTEDEVKTIVQYYLHKDDQETDRIVHTMRRLYNGYYFANTCYNVSKPQSSLLYNPHQVFHYINEQNSHGHIATHEESTAVHSTTILKSVADMGDFSVNDLVELILSGSVKSKITSEFGFVDLLQVGKDKVITWSLLFYLGILTRGSNGDLRIPNEATKSSVRIFCF